jgi:hypothetical protein
MRRVAGLALATVAYGACLYDVEDVRSRPQDSGLGGQEAGDVSVGGWSGGGTSGASADAAEGAADANDASSSDAGDGAPDAVSAQWSSCKDLGYAGACFEDSLLYFDNGATTPGCWVNDCTLKGGQCKKISGGWGCSILIDVSQVGNCRKWNTGQCHGNAAMKSDPVDPKNCLYKDCTGLGMTCVKDPDGGLADCY